MKNKIVFKSVLTLMVVSVLPFSNLRAFYQSNQSYSVSKSTIEKLSSNLKSPITFADDLKLENNSLPSAIPSNGTKQRSVSEPSRTPLAANPYQEALSPSKFGWQKSVAGLTGIAVGQVAVIKDGVSVWNNAGLTDSNVGMALNYIYNNGNTSNDFVLFIGGATTLSSTIANNTNGSTFASLAGKAKSLTIIANTYDSLNSTTSGAASGNFTVTYNANFYLGCPTIVRNATLAQSNDSLYAQGNAFATTIGSSITGSPSVYGGGDGSSNISSDTNIYLGAYGEGTWNIYGGNDSGSATLTGNTHVSIAGLSGSSTINILSGGNNTGGIINGNTNLSLTNFGGLVSNIYGAGVGSSTKPVKVNGSVANNINSLASPSYSVIYGGTQYGDITGTIYNTVAGGGGFSSNPGNFIGGSFIGNIGTKGAANAIQTSYDSSGFTKGSSAFFAGAHDSPGVNASGNAYGVVYGNITNYVRASFSSSAGTIYGLTGGDGGGTVALTNNVIGAPNDNLGGGAGNDISGANTMASNGASTYDSKIQNAISSGTKVAAIYGNIYTWEQGGYMGASGGNGNGYLSYSRAGSFTGYVNGETVIEVGSANADGSVGGNGAVSSDSTRAPNINSATAFPYNNDGTKQRGDRSGFEVGAGGQVLTRNYYWHTGDSYTIQNNVVARWTYGGNYNGFQWGTSYNVLNAGIVSQLVGSEYGGAVHFGDSYAQMNGGEVDRNITGSSWGTTLLTGNANVIVYKGLQNGIITGNAMYQVLNGVINGNSRIDIYGGDFSGQQDTTIIGTRKYFSPGIANDSITTKILGSTYMNIDLSGPTGSTFHLPSGTYITGGAPYGNSSSGIGSGASSSENLTIIAPKGNDVFNGATVYGTGSSSSLNNNVGSININIQADGSSFGNAYASYAPMYTSSAGILNNSTVKIGDGVKVTGTLSGAGAGGNGTNDNLTNDIVAKNSNTISVTLGDSTSGNPINITGKVVNFTNAQVAPKSRVDVTGGLLNGGSATAANHATTYSQFGGVTLGDNSTLGVTNTSAVVSGGKLVVGSNTQISTPYTNSAGLLNFSDFALTSGGGLTWVPTGTVNSPTTTYKGAYWGSQKGFPVLTFNGGDSSKGSGAFNVKPSNLQGVDSANNYAFLGDYTLDSQAAPSNPTWIGYVVPGQIRVFNTADTNLGSLGNWMHNLTGVSTGAPIPGTAMSAWSDTAPGVESNSIRVMYTMQYANSVNPAFKFSSSNGSYVQSRSVSRYDGTAINNYSDYNPNFKVNADGSIIGGAVSTFTTNDYFTGNQQNGNNDQGVFGSYIIQSAITNNQSVLKVTNNIIVNNTKASTLTVKQLEGLLGVYGTGVVDNLKLSNPTITSINEGISNNNNGTYNSLPVKFTMGIAETTGNIVIVPDHAKISADGQNALDVYDAIMTGDEAHAIQTDVNTITPDESAKPPIYADGLNYYTGLDNAGNKPLAINANGTVSKPTLSNKEILIPSLQSIADSGTLTANYTFNGLAMNAILTINVGYLEFTSAPENIEWGKLSVSPNDLIAYPAYSGDASGATGTGQIIITDTRSLSEASPWTLVVAVTAPFNQNDGKGSNSLGSYLMFNDGSSTYNLNSANTVVHGETSKIPGIFNLNQDWGSASGKGLYLDVPVDAQHVGTYQGQLTWTLSSVPNNN